MDESIAHIGQRVCNDFGDNYFYSVNRSTFNQIGSQAFYQAHYADEFQREDTLYIILGSDSGLLAQFIQQQGTVKGSRYLFIDFPEVIEMIKEDACFTDDTIYLADLNDWKTIAKQLGSDGYFARDSVCVRKSLAAIDCFIPAYRQLVSTMEQLVDQLYWDARVIFVGRHFIQQQLANIAENMISAACLRGQLQGKTAILLAGGPSLDAILPWLQQHSDDVYIVAVSRISRRLVEMGITPDMIVAIDPTDKMFVVSHEMLFFAEKSIFVHAYHATPLLVSAWPGQHVYLGSRYPWCTAQDEDNLPVAGPTVTNAAFDLLVAMGAKQILLAGVDLSYSAEGYSHAKGSHEHAHGPRVDFTGQSVELNDGTLGQTEFAFFEAVNILGGQAELAVNQGCQIINLNAKAAKINHVVYQAIDDVEIAALAEQRTTIKKLIIKQQQALNLKKYYQDCLDELNRISKQLHDIVELSLNAFKANEKLTAMSDKGDAQLLKKINRIEKSLESKYIDLLSVIKICNYQRFTDVYLPTAGAEMTKAEIQKASQSIFKGYAEGAKDLQSLIQEAKSRIQMRMEEIKAEPNFKKLFAQWERDQQFGRSILWKQRYAELFEQLPAALKKQFINFNQAYNVKKSAQNITYQASDYEQRKSLQGKLYSCYREYDQAGIQQLMSQIENMELDNTLALTHLAQGYLAELNQDDEAAINYYHQAAEGELAEQALNHLTTLLVRHQALDNALLALECLSQLSITYLPQYAEVAILLEKYDCATAALESYLDQMPEDAGVQKKLGTLYKQLNKPDKAKQWLTKAAVHLPNDPQLAQLLTECE